MFVLRVDWRPLKSLPRRKKVKLKASWPQVDPEKLAPGEPQLVEHPERSDQAGETEESYDREDLERQLEGCEAEGDLHNRSVTRLKKIHETPSRARAAKQHVRERPA